MFSDTELVNYLLQLVQALKHENYLDTPLARFLLRRALMNRNHIGHYFFWYLKAELHVFEFAERFELLLEVYLRHCSPAYREELLKQTSITDQLTIVANAIKNIPQQKRKAVLEKELSALKLPPHFQVAINPTMVAKSLILPKCKTMESKTLPLWLVFENIGTHTLAVSSSRPAR